MQKIRTFFRTFIKSLTEPDYYRHILKTNFSFSVKYFLAFYFLFSLVTAIDYQLSIKPKVSEFTHQAIDQITSNYPPQLELNITDGNLAVTGVTQPYHVPFPSYFDDSDLNNNFDFLLTIDTTQEFPTSKSLFTLTQTQLFVLQADGSKESIPLTDIQSPLTINKHTVQLATSALSSILNTLIKYSAVIVFFGLMFFLPIVSAIILLFYSLFVWLTASILNTGITYKKSYQIGLHLITFAETVTFIQQLLFPHLVLSQFFSLAFFGSALIALWPLKSSLPKK